MMLGLMICAFIIAFIFRIMYLIFTKGRKPNLSKNCRTLIVIGSGGHTLEMLKQVKTLDKKIYFPRLYVMANIDTSSEYKILELEKECNSTKTDFEIVKIPRSRVVNQSYFTSVFTTLYSAIRSVPVVFYFKPDLILCNGPGTCIPICAISFLLNAVLFCKTKIVFIESICRVQSLSLSGKILLHFADVIIVQWKDLQKKYPNTVYLGRLI